MMIQDYKQEFMLDGACYLNCVIREQFAHIVGATRPDSIALSPAVSYGLATIAKNIGKQSRGC